MNKRSVVKLNRIEEMKRLLRLGNSLKEISLILKISVSSLYKYKELILQDQIDLILERIYNDFKVNFNLVKCLDYLSFSEISAICRKFKLWGISRKEKILAITQFLEKFVIMNMKPKTFFSKSELKSQYFKRAKEVHPDMNKGIDNNVFIALHSAYESLMCEAIF